MFENYEIVDLQEDGSVLVIFCLASELDDLLLELETLLPAYEIEADELCDDSFSIKIFF